MFHNNTERLRLKGTPWDHPVQLLCSEQSSTGGSPRLWFSWVLNIHKNGTFTVSSSIWPPSQKKFSGIQIGFPFFQCVLFASYPLSGQYWGKSSSLHSLPPSDIYTWLRSSQTLSSPDWTVPAFLASLPLTHTPVIAVAPHWTWLSPSIPSLTLKSPKMDPALQTCLRLQCWVEGENRVPGPAGKSLPNAAQDALGDLCCKGTLPACGQPVVCQGHQLFFCKAAFKLQAPYLHGMLFPLVLKHSFLIFVFKILTIPTV